MASSKWGRDTLWSSILDHCSFLPPRLCRPLPASWERAVTHFQSMEVFLDVKKKKLKEKNIKSNNSRNKMVMVSLKEFWKRKKEKKKAWVLTTGHGVGQCEALAVQPALEGPWWSTGRKRQRKKKTPRTQIETIHHLGLQLLSGEERLLIACSPHLKNTDAIFHHCGSALFLTI